MSEAHKNIPPALLRGVFGAVALLLIAAVARFFAPQTTHPNDGPKASQSEPRVAPDHAPPAAHRQARASSSISARPADEASASALRWTADGGSDEQRRAIERALADRVKVDHRTQLRKPGALAMHAQWLVGVDDPSFFDGLVACRQKFEASASCVWRHQLVLSTQSDGSSKVVHSELRPDERTNSSSCWAWSRCVHSQWTARKGPAAGALESEDYYAFELQGGSRYTPNATQSQADFYKTIAEHSGASIQRMRAQIDAMEAALLELGFTQATLLSELERYGFEGKFEVPAGQAGPAGPAQEQLSYHWHRPPPKAVQRGLSILLPLVAKRSALAQMIADDRTAKAMSASRK